MAVVTSAYRRAVVSLAEHVREARQSRGWSPAELARAAGIHASSVSKIESGERKRLSSDVVAGLAAAFGLSTDEVIRWTEPADLLGQIERDLSAILALAKGQPRVSRLTARRIRELRQQFEADRRDGGDQ